MQHNRKLLAVLFADIAGYTSMMHEDENNAILVVNHFKEALTKSIAAYDGKIWQFYGDGCLATFESAANAIECSIELQKDFLLSPKVSARIGIHMGDVVIGEDNIHGDSVNIASRIESMGIPQSILFSTSVNDQVKNKLDYQSESLGEFQFKNIPEPLEVYALKHGDLIIPDKKKVQGKFSPPTQNFKKLAAIALVIILFLAVGGYGLVKFGAGTQTFKKVNDNTIAVLPIRDMSISGEYQNYCRGLMLAIHSNLSKVSDISLLSIGEILGSGNEYPNDDVLKSKLNMSHYVRGNMITMPDKQNMVTAELGSNIDQTVPWSGNYSLNFTDDFFTVVNEVAEEIVSQLKIEISPEKKKDMDYVPTKSTEAYSLLVRAKKLSESRKKNDLERSVRLLEKAISLDENFAQAYAELANTLFAQGYYKFEDRSFCYPESERLANKAIGIYDKVFTAHSVLATIAELVKRDKNIASEMYQKAIEINPNDATALRHYSVFLKRNRAYKKALSYAQKSAELSPYNGINNRNYIDVLIYNKNLDKAQEHLDIMVDRLPNNKDDFAGYYGDVLSRKSEFKKAIVYYEKRLESHKSVAGELGYCYGRTGNLSKAKKMISLVPSTLYHDVNVAMVYTGMAEQSQSYLDSASLYIKKAIREEKGINVLCDHPFFEQLNIEDCN